MPNALKNNLVILLAFDKVLLPARRIGQLLGSNPNAEADDVGMGPYFIVRPFVFRECSGRVSHRVLAISLAHWDMRARRPTCWPTYAQSLEPQSIFPLPVPGIIWKHLKVSRNARSPSPILNITTQNIDNPLVISFPICV